MGQIFQSGTYTTPGTGLIDPSTGDTMGVGTPRQVLAATQGALNQNFTPQLTGDPNQPLANNQNAPLPTIGNPSLRAAATAGAMPGGVNALSPGLSKAGKLATVLFGGLQGALAGQASSANAVLQSGGRRGGNAGSGFEAGYTLPFMRASQALGLEQQQGQLAQQQAQTELLHQQASMVPTPYGMMPPGLAKVIFPAEINAGAREQAAQTGANARVQTANIGATSRMGIAQMQAMLQRGQVSRLVPAQDANGNPVMRAVNKFGQPIGDIDGALPPEQYLPKTSSTVQYQTLDDGSIVALPKTTVTQTAVPGRSGSARPSVGGGGTPQVVSGPNGSPLIAKGQTTSTTRTMVETAPRVLDLTSKLRSEINGLQQSGSLGPGASRWADFWSGKVGTDNPDFRAMMTNADLLSTLLMRMHMGARGGEQIVQRFDNMLGAGHQSAANMLSAIDQIESYANDVQKSAPKGMATPASNSGGGFDWNSAPRVQ